jgi:hypothetical protein
MEIHDDGTSEKWCYMQCMKTTLLSMSRGKYRTLGGYIRAIYGLMPI